MKGFFGPPHGASATPAEEQEHLTGDVFHDDEPEMQRSCLHGSDFPHYKPRAG